MNGERAAWGTVPMAAAAVTLLLMTVPPSASGQIVRGAVIQELTRAPVVAAEVLLVTEDGTVVATTRSGPRGSFGVAGPESGRYRLSVQSPGFEPLVTALLDLGAERELTVSLELLPQATELPGLEVTVDAFARVRDELAHRGVLLEDLGGRFVSEEQIDRRIGARDLGEVVDMQGIPGLSFVRPENVWASDSSDQWLCVTMIRSRSATGSGNCAIIVLDGRKVNWNAVSSIPGFELKSIAVLNPVEATLIYGTTGGAGAVLLFTK